MAWHLIKIGGKPAANLTSLDLLLTDIADLILAGHKVALVHGGGADVTEISKTYGIEPIFIQGKRVTSAQEMDIVDMGLAGLVNTRILRRARVLGLKSVGLSGVDCGLFVAKSVDRASNNRTGAISATNVEILEILAGQKIVPVISSVSIDQDDGSGLNINADDAAMSLAIALKAQTLIYLSDIAGILKNGEVLPEVTRTLADKEIADGVISGGMIPKVNGSLEAIAQGVGSVVIGGFEGRGDLSKFLSLKKGTTIR